MKKKYKQKLNKMKKEYKDIVKSLQNEINTKIGLGIFPFEFRIHCHFTFYEDALRWTSIKNLSKLWCEVQPYFYFSSQQLYYFEKKNLTLEFIFYCYLVWLQKGFTFGEIF
jgi:hypothetical protein